MNNFEITVSDSRIDGSLIQTVSGRQVHSVLEIGQDYTNWAKNQISRARLVENRDFVKLANVSELSITGQKRSDYHFTLDAAKNIAMMSGTDKGFEVRAYFIECERKLLSNPLVPQSFSDALRLAADQQQQIEQQHAQLVIAAPKVKALALIADADGSITVREAAKDLQVKPGELTTYLRDNKWIYKQGSTYLAFQARMTAGLMLHKVDIVENAYGSVATTQARITHKGLTKLAIAFAN